MPFLPNSPLLGYWVHNIPPFIFEISPGVGPRWYGLAYVFGFLLLWLGLHYQAKRGWSILRGEHITDFVTWMALLGVMTGGRIAYCLLYDFPRTAANPLSIIGFGPGGWHGIAGMASHGGIAGAILVIYFYARAYKIPFYNLADAAALVTPLALGFGRLANFINGELWGRPTTVPWAVIFPAAGDGIPRHPSQLYQAGLEGFLLFFILWYIREHTKRQGVVALSFMGGYAIMRIIGECFRQPDAQINYYFGFITQGQILSFIMLAATIVLAWLEFRPSAAKAGAGASGTASSSKPAEIPPVPASPQAPGQKAS
ncbi:MAG TPA: prolipoprotein diacylglyceryl transferase [Candidatus Methylacidiphilales bacterium]|nr:prolipoprotein diacylglyceryl transferase [Candidatus Methylacidiphilales bacterium]